MKHRNVLKLILLLSITVFLMMSPLNVNAYYFEFSGSDYGGTGSATMEITITGNTLSVVLNNTSPTDLDGADPGTGGNSPGIRGFGFNIDPDLITLTSWELEAYDTSSSLITIGKNNDSSYDWQMGTTLNNVTLDYLPSSDIMNGVLYNPDALDDPNNTLPGGTNDVYFTTAYLTLVFDKDPTLVIDSWSPYIRMQNVGLDGEGSLKLVSVPEPTTLILLGFGLLGVAGIRRK